MRFRKMRRKGMSEPVHVFEFDTLNDDCFDILGVDARYKAVSVRNNVTHDSIWAWSVFAREGVPVFFSFKDLSYYVEWLYRTELVGTNRSKGNYLSLFESIGDGHVYLHSKQVAHISAHIAKKYCPDRVDDVFLCALYHDIGKIMLPSRILNSHERYRDKSIQREIIKMHTFYSAACLSYLGIVDDTLVDSVVCHHERCDGSGYPYGRTETAISDISMIIGVSDVYVALREDRPYRSSCDPELALSYLKANRGISFKEEIVDIMCEISKEEAIRNIT